MASNFDAFLGGFGKGFGEASSTSILETARAKRRQKRIDQSFEQFKQQNPDQAAQYVPAFSAEGVRTYAPAKEGSVGQAASPVGKPSASMIDKLIYEQDAARRFDELYAQESGREGGISKYQTKIDPEQYAALSPKETGSTVDDNWWWGRGEDRPKYVPAGGALEKVKARQRRLLALYPSLKPIIEGEDAGDMQTVGTYQAGGKTITANSLEEAMAARRRQAGL